MRATGQSPALKVNSVEKNQALTFLIEISLSWFQNDSLDQASQNLLYLPFSQNKSGFTGPNAKKITFFQFCGPLLGLCAVFFQTAVYLCKIFFSLKQILLLQKYSTQIQKWTTQVRRSTNQLQVAIPSSKVDLWKKGQQFLIAHTTYLNKCIMFCVYFSLIHP